MPTFYDILDGARVDADLVSSDRLRDGELAIYANAAIKYLWNLLASSRPDFTYVSADFAVVSGGSASIALPSDFYALLGVVYAPDTTSEYSLGPYNWQNRRAPGNSLFPFPVTVAQGGTSVRLMGVNTLFIEPSTRAGGNYRVWYVPKPKIAKFTARLVTVAALPACTGSGAGANRVLTANANGALTVDTTSVAVRDRVCVANQVTQSDNGLYYVVATGSPATPWVLRRASDFVNVSQYAIADWILIEEGATRFRQIFEITAAGAIEGGTITFAEASAGGELDVFQAQFIELLRVLTAIPAISRDDDLSLNSLAARQTALEADVKNYLGARVSNGPERPTDTDMRGPAIWGGW